MRSRLFRAPLGFVLLLAVVSLLLVTCSDDKECPTCPPSPALTQWVEYDNFVDNTLDPNLWNYIADCCGGQVLEADSQLQVWGHTDNWTGSGIVRTIEPKLAWRFHLVDTYFEEGPGCQGWHIQAIDPVAGIGVEVLNRASLGCTNPANMGDSTGTYEIRQEGDSLAVYKSSTLLRRVYDQGIDFFVLQFVSDNMYGTGNHSHIFVEDVWGLEWKP